MQSRDAGTVGRSAGRGAGFADLAGIERDRALASAILSGNERVEARFVRDHIVWMRPLAQRVVRHQSDAEDVVQDAFANAFRALRGYQGRSTLKTWLYRITVNAALMKLRQKKRLAECDIDDHQSDCEHADTRLTIPLSLTATPDQILDSQERKSMVRDALAKLPEQYRTIIQLRDLEDRDTDDVARILDLTQSNVKVRLHRARAALRGLLEPVLEA